MGGKYTGVTVRGNAIQISFVYKGKRIREHIRCGRVPRPADIKMAWEARCAALRDIDLGRFEYINHFPDSPNAEKFSPSSKQVSVEQAISTWLKNNHRNWAYSTLRDYTSICKFHLIPTFGHYQLIELTKPMIDTWINSLELSPKRINNILTPLRLVFKDAILAGQIDQDTMSRIKNLKASPRQPEPFTQKERAQILSELPDHYKSVIDFGFNSGLRTSELIALEWYDVDLTQKSIFVNKAIVRGKPKMPKTQAGIRRVELSDHACSILKTELDRGIGSKHVFVDPKTNNHWASDQPLRKRVWTPALKRAGVKYREPYQMRHTYASEMLSQGKNPLWVAKQLGHSDWGMIRKVYGRWIGQ